MRIITEIRADKNQRGFSLVEVLIALIIMSVGMLGIAGLYVQSMQAGRTSVFRHHAVTLAGDVADRIRANPTAFVRIQRPELRTRESGPITTASVQALIATQFKWHPTISFFGPSRRQSHCPMATSSSVSMTPSIHRATRLLSAGTSPASSWTTRS